MLVQQELETVVVSLDDERATPQVRPLVAHGVYPPDELTLVGCQLGKACSNRLAEERHQSGALMEDDP
jgi:hypothetical protein